MSAAFVPSSEGMEKREGELLSEETIEKVFSTEKERYHIFIWR